MESKENEEIENLVKDLKDKLEKNDISDIKSASEKLSEKVMAMSSRIYEAQAKENQAASEKNDDNETENKKNSKVKDAEYEEK